MADRKQKPCGGCLQMFPIGDFCKDRRLKDELGTYCPECRKQKWKKYAAENRDTLLRRRRERSRKHALARRRGKLRRRYGITLEQHKQIYISQNGCCALCDRSVAYDKTHTDHDHETGRLRGLLCQGCNQGLGMFKDSPVILQQAIRYLEGNK